jgi:transcriptional regulator with XRE-family HTH domain
MTRKHPSSPPPDSFSSQLRAAIRARRETPYAIAQAAGVDAAALGRFLSGERGLTTPSVDRLFAALGLRLVDGPRRSRVADSKRETASPLAAESDAAELATK